jgi:hypothetical protein
MPILLLIKDRKLVVYSKAVLFVTFFAKKVTKKRLRASSERRSAGRA